MCRCRCGAQSLGPAYAEGNRRQARVRQNTCLRKPFVGERQCVAIAGQGGGALQKDQGGRMKDEGWRSERRTGMASALPDMGIPGPLCASGPFLIAGVAEWRRMSRG